jgi:hypothetical protein
VKQKLYVVWETTTTLNACSCSFYLSAAAGGQERTGMGEDGVVLFVVQYDWLLHLHPLPCHC